MLLLHGQRCIKQCQDIPLTLRHHREFHDISAQGLHQAEIAYDDVLIRCCGKVVAGGNDLHANPVGCRNDRFHRLFPAGEFHVNEVDETAVDHGEDRLRVGLCVDLHHSAFHAGTDREEHRNIS